MDKPVQASETNKIESPTLKRVRRIIRATSTPKLLLSLASMGMLPLLLLIIFSQGNLAQIQPINRVTLSVAWLCFWWGWGSLVIVKRRTSPELVTIYGLLVIIMAALATIICWLITIYTFVLGLWQIGAS